MDTLEDTAKKVDTTYKNIIEELGPCIKQLVVAGRTYLKSIHGMSAAYRNYNEALSRVANLADNSTFKGSGDMGSAIHHVVDTNKEMLAQQSNVLKSLEFDFLEPMEIAADKDTKLIGREQKRFQQLQKNRRDDFDKSVSTLKKSKRKKSINTDKQLAHMKLMESTKTRLGEFCDESLKEAIVQERIMYGTVLEKLCLYGKQVLISHNKGCELLEVNIPKWESLANTKEILPNNCFPLHVSPEKADVYSIYAPASVDGRYAMGSPVDSVIYRSPTRGNHRNERDSESLMSAAPRLETLDRNGIYARPMVRAKSEYNLSTNAYLPFMKPVTPPSRFSRIIEYSNDNSPNTNNYFRAMYSYEASGSFQMSLTEGDIIKFDGEENVTGWQFGDNLMSKKSGWFPLSYTEPIKIDQESSHSTSNGSAKINRRPLPPPPPSAMGSHQRSSQQIQSSETSDYGTLRRLTPRRLLPVDPPMVSPTNTQQEEDEAMYQNTSMLRSTRNQESYFNASDQPMSVRAMEQTLYHSKGTLQSMHL